MLNFVCDNCLEDVNHLGRVHIADGDYEQWCDRCVDLKKKTDRLKREYREKREEEERLAKIGNFRKDFFGNPMWVGDTVAFWTGKITSGIIKFIDADELVIEYKNEYTGRNDCICYATPNSVVVKVEECCL